MSFLLAFMLFVVFLAITVLIGQQGLWAGVLMWICTILAALLATNFFEPLADALSRAVPQAEHFWDFLCLWGLFLVFLLGLRLLTDVLSRIKLKFSKWLDAAGGYFFSVWTAWIWICFLMMSLHTAPVARNPMGGAFEPEAPFMGVAPDRLWLSFMQRCSLGSLSRYASGNDPDEHVFDPDGSFMPRYAVRRHEYDTKVPGIIK
jgi:hypothetical protein